MIVKEDVELFLNNFKHKLGFWGLLFRSDRSKNFKTMLELEVSVNDIKTALNQLEVKNYSEGPIAEVLYNGADMWVFGKVIKQKEVYIKISMGLPSDKVICISFHLAEKNMSYPFN